MDPGSRVRLFLACACAALAACTAAPSRPPSAATPDDNPHPARRADGTGADFADAGWRAVFPDPRLQGLIELALTHNRQLERATAQIAEARARYRIQRADRVPGVDLGAAGERGRTPADLSLSGRPEVSGQYRIGASLPVYEIDFWGRVRSLEQAALARYLATEEARTAFQLSLVSMVADAHLAALEFEERIGLARKTLASREASYRIIRRRAEVGVISDLELRQVESLLVSTRVELAALERQREQNENLLLELIGHAAVEAPPAGPLSAQGLEQAPPAGLASALLTRRPDIRAAERELDAAGADLRAARAALFPNITLTGFAGTASAELDGLFDGGSGRWTFAPSLNLPLFDGGRRRANVALSEARRQVAVADYEAAIQAAFREVADALAARHWLADQVAHQRMLVAAESERARLANLRYERGASDYLEVLDAQRALFSAEQTLVQLRRQHMSSTVNLYKALGGGGRA